jgi:hypothetical protein
MAWVSGFDQVNSDLKKNQNDIVLVKNKKKVNTL